MHVEMRGGPGLTLSDCSWCNTAGNYVVQRALSVAPAELGMQVVDAIRPHLVSLANTSGGRRITAVRGTLLGCLVFVPSCFCRTSVLPLLSCCRVVVLSYQSSMPFAACL